MPQIEYDTDMFNNNLDFPPQNTLSDENNELAFEQAAEKLLSIAQRIEQTKDVNECKELMPGFLEALETLAHDPLNPEIERIYREMQAQDLLLRVENISRVAESIKTHTPYHVGDAEDHYANSVIPENDGIKIAFAEATAPGPVRLLIGFDVRTAISYSPESIHVYNIDETENDLRDISLRKKVCKHVEGVITPELIKHIVIRCPRTIFPEDRMTNEEKNTQHMYIFRAVTLKHE